MRPSVAQVSSNRAWFWSFLFADTSKRLFVTDPRVRIFLLSFAMLFFELLCIRWIPSYVRYLSYFNNFILLASFLGIGLGMLSARRQRFWFPPFPLLLLLLTIVVALNRFDLRINSTQVLYYGAGEAQSAQAENFIVLPIIFGMVTICFIPLGRSFGRLFTEVKPLTAYTFDIIGSLVGIASFSAIAYFSLPPVIWFAVLALPLLLLSARWTILATAVVLLASIAVAWQMQLGAYWSPYYKILLHPAVPSGYIVDVNNAGGHQSMIPWQYKEPFYRRLYELFPGKSFHHALILGAGSGSDTATALAYGVQSITAVEIDPTIQKLGAQYNPDHPYSNSHVKVVINDGRNFLQNTNERYDLIIFALPDSLTLTSSNTSLRLESFLLTQDAIATARTRLTNNGILVLYNFYRDDWLVQKLANMAGHAFNQEPFVSTYGGWGRAAVIMVGPRLTTLPPGKFGPYHENSRPSGKRSEPLRVIGEGYYPLSSTTPATDDWPFLYLVDRSFPLLYIAGLAMVVLFALAGTLTLAPRRVLRRFNWHMFFLGVAFMLLEVKSLTTFSLLFGSTWLVNSLVFFAILSSVLLAVLVNSRLKIRRITPFYLLLFGVLVLNILLPPEALLLGNPLVRYLLASVLAFTPVFLANIIFANSFRDSETADVAFASNLLGIMVGGGLEYFSMLIGYRMLLLFVIVFYACALLLRNRRQGGVQEAAVTS
ncbi:MAG: spermidine synthase [Ktedonobacteraceae bacterium]